MFDDGSKEATYLPSWTRGGGIVVHANREPQDWQLPSEAVALPSFHITLIGRKVFLGQEDAMADAWESVRRLLPLPPGPELDKHVTLATDEERKTWFLHIINQDNFRDYVEQMTSILNDAFRQRSGSGFVNPDTDRYFHLSVANNQGGDPMKSIGSIGPTARA